MGDGWRTWALASISGLVLALAVGTLIVPEAARGASVAILVLVLAQLWLVLGIGREPTESIASREMAEVEAEAARNAFMARMSHELRTPIHAILGTADILLDRPMGPEEQEFLETTRYSAEMLLALVDDLLDFSRVEAGALTLRKSAFSPRELLHQVSRLLLLRAEKKGLHLHWDIARDVPDQLWGDPLRLRQILLNLAGNAVKFTSEGEIYLRLERRSQTEGDVLRWSVRDTGVGIPQHQVSALFAPFAQGDSSAARQFGGAGLGLSISRHLVELMDGELRCDSRLGEGSTFWFEIPLTRAPMRFREESTAVILMPPPGGRVLLVDDHASNRSVAKAHLLALGYRVEEAGGGLEALEMVKTESFDAILMDCQMPSMDGYEATRRLRLVNSEVPVVAVTAFAGEAERQRCLAAGMDDHLAKPFRRPDLAAVLNRLLATEWTADSILDPGPLASLRRLGQSTGKNELAQAAKDFRREVNAGIEQLRSALRLGDASDARDRLHGIVGSAGVLGAGQLETMGRDLVEQIDAGDLVAVAEVLPRFEIEFQRTVLALEEASRISEPDSTESPGSTSN